MADPMNYKAGALEFGYRATISQIIYDSIQRFPWIAFAAGFLCGHWIWR